MDGRISVWLSTFALALGSAGCINTQNQQQVVADGNRPPIYGSEFAANSEPAKAAKKDDAPKRKPLPGTEIAFGQLKESEAESDAVKKNANMQANLRDQARQAYQRAIEIDPNCLDAYKHLGRLYTKIGDFERALDVYRKVLNKHPKEASVWYDLGVCQHRRKDFVESARCFQRAVDIDPERPEYLKKLGLTLAWLGQTEQALPYLTRAQGAALAHYNIAGLLVGRGQRDLAEHHLRLALRENPNLEPARELLVTLQQPTTASAR